MKAPHWALAALLSFAIPNHAFASDPEVLTFSFQKQKDPAALKASANKMAEVLTKELGKKVEILVPTSYSAAVQALISKKAHVAYMDSLPYILAKKETPVEILAVERRNGRTEYDSLFIVKKDSPLQSLADLKQRRMAFTSQTSTSGYLIPFARLIADKQIKDGKELEGFFTSILYAGGYDKALQAVLKGSSDVGAVSDYVIEGPKADLYGTPADRDQVRVLARTPGVPTHLVAVRSDLSSGLKKKIQNALLKISRENAEALASVYGAAELVVPKNPEAHVNATMKALKDTGLDVKHFVK